MLPTILSLVSLCVLVAEFWTGMAVTGWSEEKNVVERATHSGQYWLIMTLHSLAGVGIPTLAFLAFR